MLAKERPELTLLELQRALRLGYGEATVLFDWLADTHVAAGHISNHWIRCGRAYVLNNPCPNLVEMGTMLKIGERRAFLVMLALEKKGAIRIKEDFSFERRIRMSSFDDLVRQMQRVAKKYRGRCEPELLVRTLYIDLVTALRLAQYGEEHRGMRWKRRPKELL